MANSLTYFLAISAALVMLMFVTDLAQTNVAEEEGITAHTSFFNYDGSHIQNFDAGNYTLDEDITSQLPTGSGQADVDEDTGNFFTDTFRTMKNWLLETTGLKYVIGVLNALPNFVKIIFPAKYAKVSFALGYLWNALVIFALVFWLKGGNN